METNKQEPPLFIFVAGAICCVGLLGGLLMLMDNHKQNTAMAEDDTPVIRQAKNDKHTTYKMVGSPVIVLTSLSPDEANCLKGGGGLSCFTK